MCWLGVLVSTNIFIEEIIMRKYKKFNVDFISEEQIKSMNMEQSLDYILVTDIYHLIKMDNETHKSYLEQREKLYNVLVETYKK